MPTTTTPTVCSLVRAGLAATLLVSLSTRLLAQTAPAPSVLESVAAADSGPAVTPTTQPATTPPDGASPAPVKLSPFEVNTNQDKGFFSADTYAGGRLATPLGDSPAAYSVINQEMIQALGITNMRDVVDWSTDSFLGMDGSGGGFYFNLPILGTTRGITPGLNPYTYRQTNFFPYSSPGDSFDVERYDIGRGPNQVLFGLGGLGGNAINFPKEALTDHPFESLSVLGGSYQHVRVTADVNQPINDKLAVRVDGVYEDSSGWRDGNQKESRGVYATVTYKPFKDTEIRLNAEKGQEADAVAFTPLNDDFSGWDGKSVFNGAVSSAQLAGTSPTASGTLLANNGNNQGVTRLGSNYFLYTPGAGQIMSWTNFAITDGGGATPTTPFAGYTYNNAGNVSFNSSGGPILGVDNLPSPAARYGTAAANSAFRLPSQRFDNMPNVPGIIQYFGDIDLTIDQHIGDHLFLELAGDTNHTNNLLNDAQNGLQNTYIDINQTLPNGSANPNYLQPYGDANYRVIAHPNDNTGARFAAAYIQDFGKWGNYALNMIAGDGQDIVKLRTYFMSVEQNADNREWFVSDLLRFRQYWYGPHTYVVPTGPITYVNPSTGTNQTITPQWVTLPNGANATDTINHDAYGLIALNAKYFKNRLVLLASVRGDRSTTYTREGINEGQYPANWNGSQIIWRPDAPANWNTLSYYPLTTAGAPSGPLVAAPTRPTTNNANGVPVPNPLYANDLFQDDFNPPPTIEKLGITKTFGLVGHITPWWSVTGDLSDAFSPNVVSGQTLNGENEPNILSHGFDIGTRFSLLGGRLYIAYTHFWNYSTGNHQVPNTPIGVINNLLNAEPLGNSSSSATNSLNLPVLTGGDTSDNDNFGDEIEVTANLAPGWRFTGSWSFPFFYSLNTDPILRGYVAQNQQNFITILQADGGSLDTTQHPYGAPGSAFASTLPAGTVNLGQAAAVAAYNNIYADMASIVAGKQIQSSAPVLNLFTDYTIQRGFWKGVDLGIGDQYRGRTLIGYTASNTIVNPANPLTSLPAPNASPYTGVFSSGFNTVTGTLGYNFKLKNGTHVFTNLRAINLLDNRQIVYNGGVLRPLDDNYTSPARTLVPSVAGLYRAPVNVSITVTFSR